LSASAVAEANNLRAQPRSFTLLFRGRFVRTSAGSFHINNLGEVVVPSDIGGFLYCSNDNDHRCSGANAGAASVQALGVRHPAFTSRPCARNGCFYPAGPPRGSFMPLGLFRTTAPNARMKASMRIQ
jgi:hypothetical protein